jgi:hypothetical protein
MLSRIDQASADIAELEAKIDQEVAPYLCGDPRSTGIGGLVEWNAPFPRGGLAVPNRSRRHGGAPAATRGRTTLALARSGACLAGEGNGGPWSAHAAHPLAAVVGTGSCVRAPSLIWVREPSWVRRQDDRWGVPRSARPRGLLGPSTDRPWRQGLGGRWPQHICLPVGGHAPATVRPPRAGATGAPRPGPGRRRQAPPGCGAPGGRACAPPPRWPGCRPGGP